MSTKTKKTPTDLGLVEELRKAFAQASDEGGKDVSERNMFGGVCFCVNGNMAGGINGAALMMKCDKDIAVKEVAQEVGVNAVEMRFTGRALRGFYQVDGPVSKGAVHKCAVYSYKHARSLPAKTKGKAPKRKPDVSEEGEDEDKKKKKKK